MKSVISILMAFGLIAPATTYAMTLDEMIAAAAAGYGTIVESHSSVSTGGQTAESGESVVTGDASASSHVQINSSNSGGSVEVKTETTKNGVTETKEYSQELKPGEGAHVEASASATDEGTESEVRVDGEVVDAGAANASAASAVAADISAFFTTTIPSVFEKIVGFFWWF